MVALAEKGVLSEEEMREAMQGAVDSHLAAEPKALSLADHRAAAAVIQRMLQGANAVRASAHL
jgi:hypothetical protein